jgi:putative addiction module component (TIGR02574 family)
MLRDYDYLRQVLRLHAIGGGSWVNQNIISIFDLSPSEKLQLVEDLWDDLAATPEAVPVHEWQKEELSRRKANLMNNPASGLTWEEVKKRVRSRYDR